MRLAWDWGLVVLWMAAIFYGSSRATLPGALGQQSPTGELLRAATHIAEYAILAVLTYRAATASAVRSGARWVCGTPWLGAGADIRLVAAVLAIGVGYALFDELHQSFVPGRCFSLLDLGLDIAGIILALAVMTRWPVWTRRDSVGRSDPHGNPQRRR